jgi:hypothetical protein
MSQAKSLRFRLNQIRECARLLIELRKVEERLTTIVEEEEVVDSDAETVVLDEDLELGENFPPICPLKRQDTVPICEDYGVWTNNYTHARRY